MRPLMIIALTTMAALSLIAADLGGTWKGSMNTQMGQTAVTITIKPGDALAGRIRAGDYEGPIDHAEISGDHIYFEMRIDPGTLTFDGTLAGNQMKLSVTGIQGDKYNLICTRE